MRLPVFASAVVTLPCAWALFVTFVSAQPAAPPAATAADRALAARFEPLVRQLNDASAASRDEAEQKLLELAGTTTVECERVLKLLPEIGDEMAIALRDRLGRIRNQIADRAAKAAVAATRLTLPAEKLPLDRLFLLIQQQTGNQLDDKRRQIGVEGGESSITLGIDNELFWPAVDMLLDEANLSVYNFAGENNLAIVARGPDDGPRFGAAAYSGPFRLEVLEVQGQRNGRQPKRRSLKMQLEISWEPRLRPIAISQAAADVSAIDDTGKPVPISEPEAQLDVDISHGSQAAEMVLPFTLPSRDILQIAKLRGKLKALVPGRQVQFKFPSVGKAAGKSQRQSGVQISVEAARKNNAVWEVHMGFKLDEAGRALESHRGWVLQNVSYLVDAEGKRIEQAGFETTRQTANEVGVAYIFDLPAGKTLDDFTWIYETPAAIVDIPIEYELKNIDLP